MTVVNTPAGLDDQQKSLIKRMSMEGADWKQVHATVSGIKPVTQKLVKEMMESLAVGVSLKADAKKEGALLIEKFLSNAKEGVEVGDLSALLEQAVYRDILRRYAQSGEPLVSMTIEQLLNLDLKYRNTRLAQKRQDGDRMNNNPKQGERLERIRKLYAEKSSGDGDKKPTGPGASVGLVV
ncbi:MAG TPA: hypothetical protein ENI77_06220 [Nitrospirae bacterium]|nr:hypothetical protein [Nitrospirota bacterium]